jgi:Fic family protein
VYIYQQIGWPEFRWDNERVFAMLAEVRHRQGRWIGRMESMGFSLRNQAELSTLTEDVLKTSEIEGERLQTEQVRSSIARRMGLEIAAAMPADRHVDGVVEMLLDATRQYDRLLTEDRILAWQAALFPSGFSGLRRIRVGAWRNQQSGPMQVVSGPVGREKVYFEASDAQVIPQEMVRFLAWFNAPEAVDPVMKSALAHLWFVTIHPSIDGNGRIARAIGDMQLARSEQSPHRFYSLSAQIQAERAEYYRILETTQKGTLDVTEWVVWYLGCLDRAIANAGQTLGQVIRVAQFWESHRESVFNERQKKLMNMLLEGFEGHLTTSKWAKIAKCSQDTAYRDILDLIEKRILQKNDSGGRSTNYSIIG